MSIYHKNPSIYISKICIGVIDLSKSTKFYNNVLGFEIIENNNDNVIMGIGNKPIIKLIQAKTKMQQRSTGLYHIAFLVPSRSDLANWLYYHLDNNTEITGASDHSVSEAIYLHDIDGNGIEVYTDRPKDSWVWNDGSVEMHTKRLDIEDLFNDVTIPTNKLPLNTIIGHIHLSVLDLKKSSEFYNLLGFEIVLDMSSALFMSHNRYHHHIAMNVWNSYKGILNNEEETGVCFFSIQYPSKDEFDNVLKKLDNHGYVFNKFNNYVSIKDVNNIEIHLEY